MVVQNNPETPPELVVDLLREQEVPFRLIRLFAGGCHGNLEQLLGVIVLGGVMSISVGRPLTYETIVCLTPVGWKP